MAGPDIAEGGCTCGAVRYRMIGAPMFVHCCHCTKCQTESGSSFALNALIEASRVVVTRGAPEPVVTPTESGRGQQVWRCPDCRVALWSHYGSAKERISFVRVGTLDDPSRFPPDIHIYTRSKLGWVRLPEDARVAEAYYDLRETWPAESQRRRAEALA